MKIPENTFRKNPSQDILRCENHYKELQTCFWHLTLCVAQLQILYFGLKMHKLIVYNSVRISHITPSLIITFRVDPILKRHRSKRQQRGCDALTSRSSATCRLLLRCYITRDGKRGSRLRCGTVRGAGPVSEDGTFVSIHERKHVMR